MSTIVKPQKQVRLSQILSKPFQKSNVKVMDIVADSHHLNPKINFASQKGSVVFQIFVKPSVIKMFESRILGYKVKFRSTVTGQETSDYEISFLDDIKDIMDLGETDKDSIIKKVLEPKQIVVSSDIDSKNKVSPHPQFVPTNDSKVQEFVSGAPSFISNSMQMLKNQISPGDASQLSMPSFPVSSTAYSLDGNGSFTSSMLALQKSKSFLVPFVGDKISLVKLRNQKMQEVCPKIDNIAYGLHEKSVIEIESDKVQTNQVDIGKMMSVSSEYFDSKRKIELHKNFAAGGRIGLTITPIVGDFDNSDEKSFYAVDEKAKIGSETIEFIVLDEARNLLEPEIPPEIIIRSNTPGEISFSVKRNDPTTEKVRVCVKHTNIHTMKTEDVFLEEERDYTFTGYSDDIKHDSFRGVINKDPYVVQITAQAITRTGEGSVSTETVVKSFPSETLKDYRTNFVLVNAFLKGNSIIVEVEQDTQIKAENIVILREDLSLSVLSPSRFTTVNRSFYPKFNYTCVDSDIIPGRTYRYYAVSTNRSPSFGIFAGNSSNPSAFEVVESSDDSIINVTPNQSTLYDMVVEQTGPRDFVPTLTFRQKQFDLISDEIRNLPNGNVFAEEFLENKENFSDIAFVIVERLNRKTGDRAFVKVIRSGEVYRDEDPDSDTRYTYIFKLSVVPPQPAIILSSLTEKSKTQIGEKNLTGLINSLTKNITSFTGVTEGSDTFFSSKDPFAQIKAGVTRKESHITVNPFTKMPKIKMLSPIVMQDGFGTSVETPSLKLRWNVNGGANALNKIDEFYVYCEYQGNTTVIQTVTCSKYMSSYSFVDSVYYNEIGTKSYYVRPRFKDYTFGKSTTPIVKKKFAPVDASMLDKVKVVTNESKLITFDKVVPSFGSTSHYFEG